jgi:hypothetical protein
MGIRPQKEEIALYNKNVGGGPIKFMTVTLLALTGYFAYDLYQKKKYPHQHGYDIRDLWKDFDPRARERAAEQAAGRGS